MAGPPPGISGLSVVLTSGCNLRCAYCYQNAKRPGRMPWGVLRPALALLRHARGRHVRLLFTGGEPLLEFGLMRRATALLDAVRPPGVRVQCELVTNGTLLEDEQAAFLAANDFAVQIGFDGLPPAQDLRRRGSFAGLDALLDRLRTLHPAYFRRGVSVALTVVPRTIPYLAGSVEYFLRKEVAEILITPAITYQPDWSDQAVPELKRQLARVHRVSLDHYRRTREVPLVLFRKSGIRPPRPKRPIPMCPVADRRHLVVDVDGQVYGCVAFAESYQRFPTAMLQDRMERLRMGDVRTPGLIERLAAYRETARATDILRAKEEKYSKYGRCGDCRFLASCEVCPVSIGHQPGNDDPRRMPDFPCAFTRAALACRARFPRQATGADLAHGRVGPRAATRRLRAAGAQRRA